MNRSEDKFSNHIKAVFEEFDTEGADYGWTELRKSFPARNNRKPLYLWLSGVAASLFIIGLLFFNNRNAVMPVKESVNTAKTKPAVPAEGDSSVVGSGRDSSISGSTGDVVRRYSLADSGKDASALGINGGVRRGSGLAGKAASDNPVLAGRPVVKGGAAIAGVSSAKADSLKTSSAVLSPVKKPDVIESATKQDTTAAGKTSIQEFLEKESKKNEKADKGLLASANKKTDKDQKNLLFDVYTATYLNYYGDNPVKVNAGAGFNANLRVSNTVYFSFGAGVSQNKMTYQNTTPASMASFASDLASVVLQNGYVAPSGASKLEAQFVTIDIPIALKFYMEEKSRFYFSTGLNSSTYINQRYSGSINAYDPKGNSYSDLQGKSEESTFKGFDFGNSAILAIGMDQPIGKSSAITFEPFFKPSLTGYGERKIKINTVGLNLKLSLGGKK